MNTAHSRKSEPCSEQSNLSLLFFSFADTVDEEDEYECVTVVNSHTQDVKHVVWHPTQEVGHTLLCGPDWFVVTLSYHVFLQLLASASYDNNICIYKEEDDDWECRATLTGHTSTVWSLSFDAAGERLASCSDDRTVKIWKDFPNEGVQGELRVADSISRSCAHS